MIFRRAWQVEGDGGKDYADRRAGGGVGFGAGDVGAKVRAAAFGQVELVIAVGIELGGDFQLNQRRGPGGRGAGAFFDDKSTLRVDGDVQRGMRATKRGERS